MAYKTQQEKLKLVEQRIGRLHDDLKNIDTQSDEVIYLLEDIRERLLQCLRYDSVLAYEQPIHSN